MVYFWGSSYVTLVLYICIAIIVNKLYTKTAKLSHCRFKVMACQSSKICSRVEQLFDSHLSADSKKSFRSLDKKRLSYLMLYMVYCIIGN